jgi:hypothetical protein
VSRYHPQNVAVLCLGIAIAGVGAVFTESGVVFRHAASIALAGLFTIKGASRLRCRASDVLLTAATLCLLLLSKIIPPRTLSPLVFEVAILIILPIYVLTGLTYKSIIADQRNRRRG